MTQSQNPGRRKTTVALVKTDNRAFGVSQALNLLTIPPMEAKEVFIKPNFNTADPAPGSTHTDVLTALVQETQKRGAATVVVGDRSGPADTQEVLAEKGILDLADKLGFRVINFDTLPDDDWLLFSPTDSHWENGFHMARPLIEAEYVVTTGCLKTHGFGGHFTMSLKLGVGAVHRKHMMPQLHDSPHMRKMIAEINLAYQPQLIVLDGVEVYTDGGPMTGEVKTANVMLAGTDRVAMDAVGLAVLKEVGANDTIMGRRIFDQDQIQRAVNLGIGISGPEQIEIKTADASSKAYADKLNGILDNG